MQLFDIPFCPIHKEKKSSEFHLNWLIKKVLLLIEYLNTAV